MTEQLTLGGSPRRRRGISRANLDRTLAAWRRADGLTGDDHAATRDVLRALADAVDRAREDMRAGDGSPYVLAMVTTKYREALEWAAKGVTHDDDLDRAFRDLLAASGNPAQPGPAD